MVSIRHTFATVALVLLCLASTPICALRCYERHNNGTVSIQEHSRFDYCEVIVNIGTGLVESRFGDSDEEVYQEVLSQGEDVPNMMAYSVMSLCVVERYKYYSNLLYTGGDVQVMMRCLCSYDLCNAGRTFTEYLQLHEEAAAAPGPSSVLQIVE